jgi:hypothetical protein
MYERVVVHMADILSKLESISDSVMRNAFYVANKAAIQKSFAHLAVDSDRSLRLQAELWLRKTGISQKSLARVADISEATLSGFMSAHRKLSDIAALKLSALTRT